MTENLKQNSVKEDDSKSSALEKLGLNESDVQSFFSTNRTSILIGMALFAGFIWVVMAKRDIKPFAQSDVELSNSFLVKMGVTDMRMQIPLGGKKLDPEVNEMVEAFHIEMSEKQIPADNLKKNPFMQYVPYIPGQDDQAEKGGADQMLNGDMSTKGLKLQMTLVGVGVKSATISGFVMHKGDIINGWKILEIKQNQVVIGKMGRKHTLRRRLRSMAKLTSSGK